MSLENKEEITEPTPLDSCDSVQLSATDFVEREDAINEALYGAIASRGYATHQDCAHINIHRATRFRIIARLVEEGRFRKRDNRIYANPNYVPKSVTAATAPAFQKGVIRPTPEELAKLPPITPEERAAAIEFMDGQERVVMTTMELLTKIEQRRRKSPQLPKPEAPKPLRAQPAPEIPTTSPDQSIFQSAPLTCEKLRRELPAGLEPWAREIWDKYISANNPPENVYLGVLYSDLRRECCRHFGLDTQWYDKEIAEGKTPKEIWEHMEAERRPPPPLPRPSAPLPEATLPRAKRPRETIDPEAWLDAEMVDLLQLRRGWRKDK